MLWHGFYCSGCAILPAEGFTEPVFSEISHYGIQPQSEVNDAKLDPPRPG
jgi:hypothetical protein